MNPDPDFAKGSAETSDPKLSALLRQSRSAPPLPPRFRENVWRRIEDAEVPAKPRSWLDAMAVLVLRPRVAYAAAAVLVLAGVWLGTRDGMQTARHDEQARYVALVAPDALP
jgi:hypothetical protein